MTRNSLERRKVFWGRLASLPVIAFVVALALLSAACNNINLAGKGSGTVSLAIGDVLTKSVRSAGEPLRQTLAAGTEYIVKARLSGGHTAETSITVDSGKLAEAALSFEGIPIGVTVRLDLEVRAGNNLVWIGSTVDDHTVVSGENPLSVEVGRVSGVLLWKPQPDGKQPHDVYIAPYGNYASPFQTKFGIYTDQDTRRPYCFDSNGNLYAVVSDAAGSSETQKYNWQLDGTYVEVSAPATSESIPSNVSYLAYDNDSGKLYGLGAGTSLYNLNDNANITNNTNFPQPLGLAIHNGIAYIAEVIEGNISGGIFVTLHQYNVADGTSQKTEEIELPEVFGTDVSALTGHMIYQDGALYLSIGCLDIVLDESSGAGIAGYSNGAVIKINAATLAIETSFGQNGYLGLLDSSEVIYGKECFAPTAKDEGACFYGPMGFVAVMPKKLVIADSGLAMSANGTGSVKLSKKSRIVTIDLETEAFESVSVDGYYEPTYLTGCGFTNTN